MRSVDVDGRDSEFVATLTVVNGSTTEGDRGTFHDVTVLGFAGFIRVCEEGIGDLSPKFSINNGREVSLTCSRRPDLFTFEARESPCDENV
jgi:hypothetical protein